MPPTAGGSGKSLPAPGARPSPGWRARGSTVVPGGYGHKVPLRGGTRLIRYLSTAESTHELPIM